MKKCIALILAIPAVAFSQVDNTRGGATAVRKLSLPPSSNAVEFDPTNVVKSLSQTAKTRAGSGINEPEGFRRANLSGNDAFTGDCPPGMTASECANYQFNLNSRNTAAGTTIYGRETPNPYNRGPISKLDWDFAVASPINNCLSGSVTPGTSSNIYLNNADCESWFYTGGGGPFWSETRQRPANSLPACYNPSNGEFSYFDQFDVNARGHRALNKITLTGGGLPDRDYYYSCLQETTQLYLAPIERTANENLYHAFFLRDLQPYTLAGTVGLIRDLPTANYLCGRIFNDYPSLKNLYPGFVSASASSSRFSEQSVVDIKGCTVDKSTFTTSSFFTGVAADGQTLTSKKSRECLAFSDLVCEVKRASYLNGSSVSRP